MSSGGPFRARWREGQHHKSSNSCLQPVDLFFSCNLRPPSPPPTHPRCFDASRTKTETWKFSNILRTLDCFTQNTEKWSTQWRGQIILWLDERLRKQPWDSFSDHSNPGVSPGVHLRIVSLFQAVTAASAANRSMSTSPAYLHFYLRTECNSLGLDSIYLIIAIFPPSHTRARRNPQSKCGNAQR